MGTKIINSLLFIAVLGVVSGVSAQPQVIYDNQGRVISTVESDGNTKTSIYDSKGEKSKTIDNNGKVTVSNKAKDGKEVLPAK